MTTIRNSSYNPWKFDASQLADRERTVVRFLIELMRKIPFDCVVVHGTSGTFLAPALVKAGIPTVMVRKEGENSHGSMIEGTEGNYDSFVFLDDFTSSGDTVRKVLDTLTRERKFVTDDKINCKAIVLHEPDMAYSGVFKYENQIEIPKIVAASQDNWIENDITDVINYIK
jgi:hypothetical protein